MRNYVTVELEGESPDQYEVDGVIRDMNPVDDAVRRCWNDKFDGYDADSEPTVIHGTATFEMVDHSGAPQPKIRSFVLETNRDKQTGFYDTRIRTLSFKDVEPVT